MRPNEVVIIAVMGVTGVGKSTFIKHATGQKVVIGHGQESCTSEVFGFQIPGTNVLLIDTPGFDDTFKADATILDHIDQCLADFYQSKQKIAGVIYIHPITEPRMKGSAVKNLNMFRKVVGKDNMASCCLVTTKWSLQDMETSVSREDEIATNPKFWKPLLDRGARMARFDDSQQSAIDIIKPLVNERGFIPQITIETQIQGKRLVETEAGQEVNVNLEEAVKSHKAEMSILTAQHQQALIEKDEELAQMIEDEKRRLEAELDSMRSEREVLKARMADRMRLRSAWRWCARGTAALVAAVGTAVSGGTAAVPMAALYTTVETLTQVDRALEQAPL
ncbi:hypothetical protein IQ07DRAFT_525270 [Pyrenochaeta sp. DS3sAY3a]|nr:hypothetical protein IQ07DRAFT_525270 [Pyrenochaeta sp. DS3sAY3a]